MWNSSRRIALLSIGMVTSLAGALAFAWLTDRLPIRLSGVETGQLAEASPESEQLDWSQFEQPGNGLAPATDMASSSAAPPVFLEQSEPESWSAESVSDPQQDPVADQDQFAAEPVFATVPERQTAQAGMPADEAIRELFLPSRFPDSQEEQEPAPQQRVSGSSGRAQRFNLETQPHQIVQQAAYADDQPDGVTVLNNAASRRSVPPQFESERPSSLSQARLFPSEVEVVNPPVRGTDSESRIQLVQATVEQPGATSVDNTRPSGQEPPSRVARAEPTPQPQEEVKVPALNLQRIEEQYASGDIINAHRDLSQIYWLDPAKRPQIMEYLNRSAEIIYFTSTRQFMEPHVVQPGELMQSIAPKYQLSWQYLSMLNRTDPKRLRAGQKLKVVKGPFSVFIDLSDFELTVHHHGFFVRRYQVCTGKNNSTPTGRFKVLDKIPAPQYTDPEGRVIPGGDPANPLGTHWIDLGDSYGIHGTIEPETIGKAESRGCVRLRNEEVEEVYNFLVKGSEVVIHP